MKNLFLNSHSIIVLGFALLMPCTECAAQAEDSALLHKIDYDIKHPDTSKPYDTFIFSARTGLGIPASYYATLPNLFQSNERDLSYGDNRGFAKPGFHFDLNANFMLSRKIGFVLMAGGTINPLSVQALEESTFILISGDANTTVVSTSANYYVGEYFLGITPTISFKHDCSIQFILAAGLVSTHYSGNTTTYTNKVYIAPNSYDYYTSTQVLPSWNILSLGWHLGVSISKKICESANFIASLSYTDSIVESTTYAIHMPLALIEPSVGISFGFDGN